jgi:hypothetical protein
MNVGCPELTGIEDRSLIIGITVRAVNPKRGGVSMFRCKAVISAVVAVGLFLGAASAAFAADSANVKLSPQSDSKQSGTATLTKQGDKQTKVVLSVTGGTGSQPAHIHKGTCAKLDPKPAFPLSPVANGKSETVVNASLDDLAKGGYAINGHKSAEDIKTYVFCGDIKGM